MDTQTESMSVNTFNWNDFTEVCRNNPSMMVKYLTECGCKLLGKGTGRAVYALGKEDTNGMVNGPCVLKVAIHPQRGIGQNKFEIQMLKKYQNRLECFPKLYAYDTKGCTYLLVEVGTPMVTAPATFANKYIGKLRKYFENYIETNEFPADSEQFSEDDFDIRNIHEFTNITGWILGVLCGDEECANSELFWLYDMIKDMVASDDSFVRGIGDVFKYASRHGSTVVSLEDFGVEANWGFVKRDGQVMLIPIDWGASTDVIRKYYESLQPNTITLNQLRKLIAQ